MYIEAEVGNVAVYDIGDVIEGQVKVRAQKRRLVSKVFMDLVFHQSTNNGTLLTTRVLAHNSLLRDETIMHRNDTFTFSYSLTVPYVNPANGSMLLPSVDDGSADIKYFLRTRVHYYESIKPAEHFHRITLFPKYPKAAIDPVKGKRSNETHRLMSREYGKLTLKLADPPVLTTKSTTIVKLQATFASRNSSDRPPEIKRLGYMLRAVTRLEDFPLLFRVLTASTRDIGGSTLNWSFRLAFQSYCRQLQFQHISPKKFQEFTLPSRRRKARNPKYYPTI